jgi:catechol 2,3-dioxygenase-like lactoylglutathione lyase family enzyme
MATWPGGIAAITLFAEDLDETKRFYQEVFGLEGVFEDAQSAVFRFGETLVNLLDVAAAPELIEPARVATADAGSRVQFTLEVDDVDATCAELARRGVDLLNGPLDRPWGVRTASFRDPAGHIWEIAS